MITNLINFQVFVSNAISHGSNVEYAVMYTDFAKAQ